MLSQLSQLNGEHESVSELDRELPLSPGVPRSLDPPASP